jgi:hypothetical protein
MASAHKAGWNFSVLLFAELGIFLFFLELLIGSKMLVEL